MRPTKKTASRAQLKDEADLEGNIEGEQARQFIYAMFAQAIADLQAGEKGVLGWFEGPMARHWAELLGYDVGVMVANARRIAAATHVLCRDIDNPDHLRVAHTQYCNGEVRKVDLERAFGSSLVTLHKRWIEMGIIDTNDPDYADAMTKHQRWIASGLSLREYERRNGLAPKSLGALLRRHGLQPTNSPVIGRDEAAALYREWMDSGVPITRFEREHGLTIGLLRNRFQRMGLETQREL